MRSMAAVTVAAGAGDFTAVVVSMEAAVSTVVVTVIAADIFMVATVGAGITADTVMDTTAAMAGTEATGAAVMDGVGATQGMAGGSVLGGRIGDIPMAITATAHGITRPSLTIIRAIVLPAIRVRHPMEMEMMIHPR